MGTQAGYTLELALIAAMVALSLLGCSGPQEGPQATVAPALSQQRQPTTVPTPVPNEELLATVDEFFTRITRQFLGGAVLVSRGEEILISKGYGMADFQDLVPNTPQTVFPVSAWFDEAFRGMAAMLLQERGLLNVDQPVARYLPEYGIDESVTVHHLLTHTSGLPGPLSPIGTRGSRATGVEAASRFLADDELRKVLPLKVEDVVESFKGKPLEFAPGGNHGVTISNQVVFALLVEELTGKPYEQFVEDEILRRLGMANTSYCGSNRPAGTAVAYQIDLTPVAAYMDATVGAYGGPMCTTVEDLYLWGQALRPGKLLSKDSITKMFARDIRRDIGYGWYYGDFPRGRWVLHGAEGVRVRWYIEEEVFVAVLGNAIISRTRGQALSETAGYLAETVLTSAR